MLMCLLLCFSFSVTASAKTIPTNTAQPYYEMASKAESKLSISGTTATCENTLRGDPNVDKNSLFHHADHVQYKTGLSGGKHRLKTVFTLTDKQNKTETITVTNTIRRTCGIRLALKSNKRSEISCQKKGIVHDT